MFVNKTDLVNDRHGTSPSDMWSSTAIPATIEFAFDKAYRQGELRVWNSNQNIESYVGFGIKEAIIETSLDGVLWTPLGDNEGRFTLTQAPGTPDYNSPDIIPGYDTLARFVRITALSVHGIAPQTGLSEVQFELNPSQTTEP